MSQEIPDILSGLDQVMQLHKKAGFKITTLYGDKEFKPFKDIVYDKYKSALNCSCAQEHIPKTKNNNKVIKEYIQATYHALPFDALFRIITNYLVMEATRKLNFLTKKQCISLF